ncbi:RNA 2',3'-cyclic phosphodiesterase [Bacillus sp. V3B]|uniref:RNA 2',3'-cyclic phosphodiesterase n=1 Tax=Bacillus sp. V3B TaxID=2804915 RepID=UPI0021095354|nr:RNA 2',3'-cyclic phosphodiesterase [Bacillus sp. V3B]MCQ6274434.1 RNA 2',3'-cyclic phosphodiesterase [Bacillus sp. V3B]
MEKNPHYFWAIRLPDYTKQSIHTQLTSVKKFFPFKRWVHMEDYHITLSFLGAIEKQNLDGVVELVDRAIKEVKAFSLHIQGLNIFGNKKAPRIFWTSVTQEKQLESLQSLVFKSCLEAGFSLETRPFTPHITLARNWTGSEFEHKWLEQYNPFKTESLSFIAEEVVLYKTNLEKTPKYEPIATISLLVE